MLTMLAEVASQELYHETNLTPNNSNQPIKKKRLRTNRLRKMTVKQLQVLSANQLINLFAILEGDEMKKTFYYQCRFSTHCSARFFSFGSEDKARLLIKDHLLKHVQQLQPDVEVETPRKHDSSLPKKLKVIKKVVKSKPVETVVSPSSDVAVLKESGHLQTSPASAPAPKDEKLYTNETDHDYHRRSPEPCEPKSELFPGVGQIVIKQETSSSEMQQFVDTIGSETFHLKTEDSQQWHEYVVGSQPPFILIPVVGHEEVVCTESDDVQQDSQLPQEGSEILDEELVQVKMEEPSDNCGDISDTSPDAMRSRKPKGKAKFIGQSAAEKEMAIEMIKAVKRKENGPVNLHCQICNPPRHFTAPTTLISHYRSHAGIKPYECVLCKAVFTRQHSLNYHLLIHLNQTRFTCEECGRKFRHPSHFKEHQRRHTGESPFGCTDCELRFKTRNTFKRHLKTRHGKVLTQAGGIVMLSLEEFERVRTCPREKKNKKKRHQTASEADEDEDDENRHNEEGTPISDLDKENSRGNEIRKTAANVALKREKMENNPGGYITLHADDSRFLVENEYEVIPANNVSAITAVGMSAVAQLDQPSIMLLSPNNANYYQHKVYIS